MTEPATAQGKWFADCGLFGWHLRWELGRANAFVPIDQFGRVRSACHQYCALDFSRLSQTVSDHRRPPGRSGRFGSRHSRERHLLCLRIASVLNGLDVPLIKALPEEPTP